MDKQERLQHFYASLPEPTQSSLLYLKNYILQLHPKLNEDWKYSMPFICFGKKMFCYFWFEKKDQRLPYLAFADGYRMAHPLLEQQDRKRFKIFRFDAASDVDIKTLNEILEEALQFYT